MGDVVDKTDTEEFHQLGVCYSHFVYDQNDLHSNGAKRSQPIEQSDDTITSAVDFRLCLFCNKKKSFFSRGGTGCSKHLRKVTFKCLVLVFSAVLLCLNYTRILLH